MSAETFTLGDTRLELSHLDKEIWPGRFQKRDLIAYYLSVAEVLLPHLRGRLVTLLRFPDGVDGPSFFQKAVPQGAPEFVASYDDGGKPRLLVEDERTLTYLANLAAVELHIALWRIPRAEPDLAVIDLDPTPPLRFQAARDVAFSVKDLLDRLGLPSFVKTSGADGLHIFVPLDGGADFAEVRDFVRSVGQALRQNAPDKVTLETRVARRHGVFVDVNQNGRSRTMVAPYSLRATPLATVSTPVTWEELAYVNPEDFRLDTVPRRIRAEGDPWSALREGPAVTLPQLPCTPKQTQKRAQRAPANLAEGEGFEPSRGL